MPSYVYNSGLLGLADGSINYLTDDVRLLIVDNTYAFNKAHDFVDDVAANEVTNATGTGYERKVLANKTVSLVGDRAVYDADDITFNAVTTNEQFGGAVIYKEAASDAARELVAFIDFNDLPTNGSDIQIQFSADGLFRITNVLT